MDFRKEVSLEMEFELMALERETTRQAKAKVAEFVSEMEAEQPEVVKECRMRYLNKQIKYLEVDNMIAGLYYKWDTELDMPYEEKALRYALADVEGNLKKLDKLRMRLRFLETGAEGNDITMGMIQAAKEYPLDNIIEIKRGYAHCINHSPDNHASLWCKNNIAYCFSCGWSGDSIAVAQKIYNLTFPQAVKRLNSQGGK
jgi:hypothetical protein